MSRTPAEILGSAKTIALVGASPNPMRPSNRVMRYLLEQGYDVRPVRPLVREVLGVPCVATLAEIDEPIDLVDVFRRADACPDVAREAVAAGAKGVWLQLGLVSPEARRIAEEGGLEYVENRCTAIVHESELGLGLVLVDQAQHEVADRDEEDERLLRVHEDARVVLILGRREPPQARRRSRRSRRRAASRT